MAELGSIQYQGLESGVVSPSRGQEEVRALGQVLDAVGEMHQADVLGDYREEQSEIIQEHRDEAETATVFDGATSLDGDAGEISRRAKVLQAQIKKGNSNQRALAELEMKKLFDKYAASHRSLIAGLKQEYGLAVTMDTRLDEIGIIDGINKTNAELAQQAYTDMIDHAHRKWEDGGLGIDVALPPSDPRFAIEYATRQQVRDLQQQNQINITLAATIADMDVRDKVQFVEKSLVGKGSMIVNQFDSDEALMIRFREELAKPVAERNNTFIQQFKDVYQPAMIERALVAKQQLAGLLPGVFQTAAERNSDEYAKAQLLVDDWQKRIDLHIDALGTENRDAADFAQASTRVAALDMRAGNQDLDRLMTIWDPKMEGVGPMLDVLHKMDLTGAAANLRNQIAGPGLKAVADAFADLETADVMTQVYVASGQGRIVDSMTPAQMRQTLQGNWSGTEGFYGKARSDEKEDIKEALAHLELLRQMALDSAASKSPHATGLFMTDAANSFLVMTALGRPTKEQTKIAMGILSDPAVFEAALVEGNGQNQNRRFLLADSAQDFVDAADQARILDSYYMQLQQPFLGAPLKSYLEFIPNSDTPDKSTEFTFNINEDYLAQQANAFLGGGVGPNQLNAYMRTIKQRATGVVRDINAFVRASAHIEAMGLPTIDEYSADYLNAANDLGVLDFYKGN